MPVVLSVVLRDFFLIYLAVATFYPLFVFVYVIQYYFRFAKKRRSKDYEHMAIEYDLFKKIFLYMTLILVLFIILSIFFYSPGIISSSSLFDPIASLSGNMSLSATIGAGLVILIQVARRESRFSLAKGYCTIAAKKRDEFEKSKYLFNVLQSYNKYLQRRSHIEIKDIKKIYTAIIMTDTEERNQITKSICDSLESNGLELAKYLSSTYKITKTDFFVSVSIVQQLKVIGTILAGAIPILISIVQLILRT